MKLRKGRSDCIGYFPNIKAGAPGKEVFNV